MKKQFYLCYRETLNRLHLKKHIVIALFVGSMLNLLNQFDAISNLNFVNLNVFKVVITYLIPFSVSVYSAATINQQEK